MNHKTIKDLIEGQLSEDKEREVIAWLIKHPGKRKYYELSKARYTARILKEQQYTKSTLFVRNFDKLFAYTAILFLILFVSIAKWNAVKQRSLMRDDHYSAHLTPVVEDKKEEQIKNDSTLRIQHFKSKLFTQLIDENKKKLTNVIKTSGRNQNK